MIKTEVISEDEMNGLTDKSELEKAKKTVHEWTDDEDDFLKSNYSNKNIEELSLKLDRTKNAIRYRASRLDLKKRRKSNDSKYWTDEEEDFLERKVNNMSYKEIANELDRTFSSVSCKAQRIGLKPEHYWDDESIECLKNHYYSMTNKEIAEELDKSPSSITQKAQLLGLERKKIKKEEWLEGELHECQECGEMKELKKFPKKGEKRKTTCKKCVNDRVREKMHRKERKLVDILGDKCEDCGKTYPLPVYDFHHTKDKSFGICTNLGRPLEELRKEAKKCVLLCANCHRLRKRGKESTRKTEGAR